VAQRIFEETRILYVAKRLPTAKAAVPSGLANKVIKAALADPWVLTRFGANIISVMEWYIVSVFWW
jgi:hypothetical protein